MTGATLEATTGLAVNAAPPGARRNVSTPRVVLAVAVLGCFMAFVDATIVNIAIPDIALHFAPAGFSSVSWVLNAYNIVFAAFLVGGGQLADLLGRRRVFCGALLLFTLASGLCALAPSLNLLIAARAVQAVGAAALVPSSLAIVLEAHDARERMHAIALWSAVAALAAGIGPPLGGLLITASSWRLVFLVNIPVGLVAFWLARRVLVESRAPGRRYMPDVRGGLVLALAIASLVLAVVKGPEWGWGSWRVLGAFAAALLLAAYFVVRSSRQRTPVVELSMFRIRAFALSNGATVVMASGFYAYTLCNVLFLTIVWRYSILAAGLALTPGPFVAIAVAGPASRLVQRVGHRRVVVPGGLVWAAGMLYFATQLSVAPDFLSEWLPGMVVLGVGAGLTFPTLSGAAVGSVPGTRFALASSLNSVARQLGAALGVAILAAILGNPARAGAMRAFEHGWLFASACFLIGSLSCLGLVVKSPTTRDTLTDAAREQFEDSAHALVEGELVDDRSLPRLSHAHAEQAVAAKQSVAEFLRNVPVFAPLSDAMRAEIAEIASAVSLKRDEWLFREHEAADSVYVVRLGQLEVLREGSEPETVNTLTRGAVLGELALLADSSRNASVRALRDTELLQITRTHFESLLRSEPELTLSLARALGAQLKGSRVIPPRRGRPVTVALYALGDGVPLLDLADELSRMLCTWGRVAVLHPAVLDGGTAPPTGEPEQGSRRAEAAARFTPLVERCELEHDHVILVCGSAEPSGTWEEFCLARADRVIVVVDASGPGTPTRSRLLPRGCDLLGYGIERGSATMAHWLTELAPASTFAVRAGVHRRLDMARVARRLAGRAVGVVLSGGGARAFAHIGVLETLQSAGVVVDRVGGVSMGAFIGGLLACGHGSDAIDAYCYEEWVRRNPMNDYTVPRNSLIKGEKARAMLERVYGDVRLEELDRAFYSASVDLRRSSLVIERDGPVFLAVGSSMAMPLIVPPQLRADRLLIDGSLLDNLPLAPMTSTGEGPVLAVDIKGGVERGDPGVGDSGQGSRDGEERRVRLPSLTGTIYRIALLSSANTAEAARLHADFKVEVRVPTVGLFEFHQIDEARAAGRLAAARALEDPPPWLLPARAPSSLGGRRTVLRV